MKRGDKKVIVEGIVKGFLSYLKKEGKLSVLAEMVEEEEMRGKIISVIPLSRSQIRRIESFLEKRLRQKVKMKNVIDKKILGGLIIRFKDLIIDESVSGKLKELKRQVYGYR